jgi:hypothetical protein
VSPQEANAVLSYCVGADSRLASSDEDQAAARTQVWADILSDVDAQFGLNFCRRYYDAHHDWPVQPGAIKTAWRNHVTVQEAKTRHTALLGRPVAAEDDVTRDARLAAREQLRVALAETGPQVPAVKAAPIPRPVRDDVFYGGTQ